MFIGPKTGSGRAGFSLVEVVLALGITTFCLLVLLGLLSVANVNNAASFDQTTATSLASAIVSDLRASLPSSAGANSMRYGIPMPSASNPAVSQTAAHTLFLDSTGTLSGSIDANANPTQAISPQYRVSLTYTGPATGSVIPVRVLVTWPGLADPTATGAPSKFLGSFETVVGLNLN